MKTHYIHTDTVHNLMAPSEVVPILVKMLSPNSVVDVGCGTGTWLKIFHENHNIDDLLGLDGSYVDKSQLVIEDKYFKATDLSNGFDIRRKFDLLLSLEVAEHLPKEAADTFIESLCKHSDNIIFSAAIPDQGGQNHINEQWPEYWMKKFEKHGYYYHDVIRPLIWNNNKIDWWYRQNIFLVNKQKEPTPVYTSIIHPELYNQVCENFHDFRYNINQGKYGIKNALKILMNSILQKIKR